MGQREFEESARQIAESAREQEREKLRKRKAWLTVGKWVADNIVAIGALIVAIISLIRTL